MQRRFKLFIQIIFVLCSFLVTSNCLADNQSNSLFATSIPWNMGMAYSPILEAAPKWPTQVITRLFNVYQNLKFNEKPDDENQLQYNIHFINYYWGPIDNPFNKYPRPAKVFVFLFAKNKPMHNLKFFMAPLIQDASDHNFYVFDRKQTHPILLNDWINQIRSTQGYSFGMRLNVCTAYADFPNDSCLDKSYANETSDSHQNTHSTYVTKPSQLWSAKRNSNEDWRSKIQSYAKPTHADISSTIYDESIAWDNLLARNALLKTVASWPNYPIIKVNFAKIRDLRYFADNKDSHFARRISWLYPDDGCWTRGAAVIKDFFGPLKNQVNNFPRPTKVFAFGNLCANTANSASGRVTWWYHTAPIVRDAQTNQTYVLDPSVNPYQPLTMESWITAISSNSGACSGMELKNKVELFNICNGYGVNPHQACKNSSYEPDIQEANAALNQRVYQTLEKNRQIELGRDPEKVLGDAPPWGN